jgi:polyhydroxyalkanoate synthesis regulator phasin
VSVGRLQEIAERLRQISAELAAEGQLGDERAVELSAEAADLSAEAVEEANRQAREAASAE